MCNVSIMIYFNFIDNLLLMASAHGPIFCHRQVKIGFCVLTFGPRKNFFSELPTTKNRSVCGDSSPIKKIRVT